MRKFILLPLAFLSALQLFAQNFPEGFNSEDIADGLYYPGGILHADTGISYVWELSGKLWLLENGQANSDPVIDISEEVGFWGDHAMIGGALHPDFKNNGLVYLYYVVDRHHLMHYGTPEYDPNFTEEAVPVMGRLTRYQIDTSDFNSVIPNSRKVILGEEPGDGLPIPTYSHGVGAVAFGEDGSLLLSTGDGNTWEGSTPSMGYNGTGPVPPFGFDSLALEDGILKSEELLGAYRAQYLDGLNGKILRIHPETGEGLPNNPFFDPSAPNSPRSKIYALGFRNPYRFTLKPGTGYGQPEDGFPGIIYVNDVGDWVWEELNVVREPGRNFGWPMFQGPMVHHFYFSNPTQNTNAPNPMAGAAGCEKPFFDYQNTVLPSNADHNYTFMNPCSESEEIPEEIITFVHERPVFAYANEVNQNSPYAVYPSFDEEGNESFVAIDDSSSIVEGESFTGLSTSGGVFLSGDQIPDELQGTYVFADFSGWIRAAEFNENHELTRIEVWDTIAGRPLFINQNPYDGCIYYASLFPSFVRKICYGGNLRPVVEVSPDTTFGPSPLSVGFSTAGTYDPEGGPLTYLWEFCDGTTSAEANPTHTFYAANSLPQSCEVSLTVSDTAGGVTQVYVFVSLNNTPPLCAIASIEEGDLYSISEKTELNLFAEISDTESTPEEMEIEWSLFLHHNTHFHLLSTLNGNGQSIEISPTGCSPFEKYWYEIQLEVTDPGGLTSTDSIMIYPDCEGVLDQFDLPEGESWIMKPNPVSRKLEIHSITPFDERIEYSIFSPQGRLIQSKIIPISAETSSFQVNVAGLQSGMYILKFKQDGEWHQGKFIKLNR